MSTAYPEFQIRLPHGGPAARGRLLDEKGTNGSQKFLVLAGSPVRHEVAPSFSSRALSSHKLRERLISDGDIVESARWPGYLETARDIVCNSPSAAAARQIRPFHTRSQIEASE